MITPVLKDLLALKRLKNPFITKGLVSSKNVMLGNFTSKVLGQGLNFESNREYVANDDLRHINWRLTAKNNKPYVKTYTADTDQVILVVVDNNSYMHFGTRNTFKSVIAADCAALIGWQCLAHKERIGFYSFGGEKIKQLASSKNENQVIGFLQQLCVDEHTGVDVPLATVLKNINQQKASSRVIYIVSDFINAQSADLAQEIKIMRQKNKVILISIYDKFDYDLPIIGNVAMLSGIHKMNLVLSPENVKRYNLDWQERKADFDKMCLGLKITNYWISTEQKWNS